jgi:hypothetical protein
LERNWNETSVGSIYYFGKPMVFIKEQEGNQWGS